MSTARTGFIIEARCALDAAQDGSCESMLRHLAAAHALALYCAPELLAAYRGAEKEAWDEYEQWKTTTAG